MTRKALKTFTFQHGIDGHYTYNRLDGYAAYYQNDLIGCFDSPIECQVAIDEQRTRAAVIDFADYLVNDQPLRAA